MVVPIRGICGKKEKGTQLCSSSIKFRLALYIYLTFILKLV
jgi:hypothetical protein